MEDDVYERVRQVISEVSNCLVDEINLDTRINYELGVAALDGDELIIELEKHFDVDMSGMDTGKYFGGDAWFPFPRWLFGLKDSYLKPLTVRAILNAVKLGKWDDKEHLDQSTPQSSCN